MGRIVKSAIDDEKEKRRLFSLVLFWQSIKKEKRGVAGFRSVQPANIDHSPWINSYRFPTFNRPSGKLNVIYGVSAFCLHVLLFLFFFWTNSFIRHYAPMPRLS